MIIGTTGAGTVVISTTIDKPHSIEFWAERLANRLIHVGAEAPPGIREQALAFQERIRQLALVVLQETRTADRAYIAAQMTKNGYADLAEQIKEL